MLNPIQVVTLTMYTSPVSIIIPNYNGERILRHSLADVVAAAKAYSEDCEIIVVDDASVDNSVPLIAKHFPDIKLVSHTINKGFAEAVHSGVRIANHPILLLLNTDVFPNRQFIAPLIRRFGDPDTFGVSPLITDPDGRPGRISWNRRKFSRGEIRRISWELDHAMTLARRKTGLKSLYAQAGAVALRKEMFLQLDGFLPVYKPFYYEDCDLCTRAWQHGWPTYFEPASTVVHDHLQGSIARDFTVSKIKRIKKRNRFIYHWLHLSFTTLVLSHIPWLMMRLLWRMLRLDVAFVLGFFSALTAFGRVIKLRRQHGPSFSGKSLEEVLSEIEKSP
jgi:GT2 family glycosyltransferase